MKRSTTDLLTTLSFLIFSHCFATCYAEVERDQSTCEVIYKRKDEPGNTIYCKKTKDSLSDLKPMNIVMKYTCNDEILACDDYKFLNDPLFISIDCSLKPETFNICNDADGAYFLSQEGNENPILRNKTFNSKFGFVYIELRGNAIKSIESGAFGCLEFLDTLDLSNNSIESLPVDVFKCMPQLSDLNLQNNRIGVLSQGTFDSLHALRKLNLSSNLITHLPVTMFANLVELQWLHLGSNRLESLSSSMFSELKNLTRINLRKNNLKDLKESCFLQQGDLYELDIGVNVGLVLSSDSFAGLIKLKYLYMDGCESNLTTVASSLFLHTPTLEELRMQHNHLQEIAIEVFRPLKYITRLNLSSNDVAILGERLFEHNTRLLSIDLSRNTLKRIKNETFRGLSHLNDLGLSHNSIANVAPDSFDDLQNLRHLRIDNNVLLSTELGSHPFQSILPKLTQLQLLDMSNSSSDQFTIEFTSDNRKLVKLDISKNVGLLLQRNTFEGLIRLKTLHMHDCNLTFSDYPVLDQFQRTFSLEEIDLSGNQISKIEGHRSLINNFNYLRHLDFSKNMIESFRDDTFRFMKELKFLNLSNNYLLKLPEPLFKQNRNLRVIDISSNRLTNVRWKDIRNADRVLATHNKIKYLNIPDISATNIQTIHLEANAIQRVLSDSDLLKTFESSVMKTRIYLSGNPLTCDFRAFNDYKYLKEYSLHFPVYFADGLICQHPPELKGSELRKLCAADFSCEWKASYPEECHCCGDGPRVKSRLNNYGIIGVN